MSSEKCIDAYGNERKEGHIYVDGHVGCPRCGGRLLTTDRDTEK